MKEMQKPTTALLLLIAVAINVGGKQLAMILNPPLWIDAVGTILTGMTLGPWFGMAVGLVSNLISSVFDMTTAFYAMVNVAVGIASGVLFNKKQYGIRHVFLGALCITMITSVLCVPMNLVFYEGSTGNLIGDRVLGRMLEAGIPEALCAVSADVFLEIPDKVLATFAAYSLLRCLLLIERRYSVKLTCPEEPDTVHGIFYVLPQYHRIVIGSLILYAVLVMMLIQAYIIKGQHSMFIPMLVVFIYLCIASAVIIFTIWRLSRQLGEERKKYENELTIRNEQLQEALKSAEVANKSKSDFLFNMSHDIRTPMNAVIGFTDMAVKYIDNREKTLDCLAKTRQAGDLLLTLINSVLDLSRIESGRATLEEQDCDVFHSFTNIESTLGELASARNITLTFEFGDIRDRYIRCDVGRCLRVFVNIISNSIKYTNEGGYVRVRCEQVGEAKDGVGTYLYTFEDNGVGMSEEFQKHVFEQFSRETQANTVGVQGTGLGMSVCKSFVDLMGGTIGCRSRLGEGTTFTVTLPFRLRNSANAPDTVEELSSAENGICDLNGKTVLLVEDNELNREICVDILEDEGLRVDTVENGAAAVDILREKGPNAYNFILMDIQMPVMNGYEATKVIRTLYPDAVLPIIALSANAFSEDKEASIAAGMNDHISKPINIDELLRCLKKYL